jgi:glycerophosphoryl diester phosphodiesterase
MIRQFAAIAAATLALAGCCPILGPVDITIESPRRAISGEPIVIAHRGASAYLPEHTLEAYTLAHAMQADAIEPDVVFTRDRVAICAHDIVMEEVTDVEQKFPDRARADGSWYWIDFDLDEIKTLSKTGRRSPLDTDDAPGYAVATLDEMITLVERLDRASRGYLTMVGVSDHAIIVPELKQPDFYESSAPGFDAPAALIAALRRHGFVSAEDPCIIQCFDLETIERLATLTELRLMWLTEDEPTDEQLDRAAAVAAALGPAKSLLETPEGAPKPLLAEAKRRGLALYPWTFRNTYAHDGVKIADTSEIRRFMFEHGVDGLFCDNPDLAVFTRTSEALNSQNAD